MVGDVCILRACREADGVVDVVAEVVHGGGQMLTLQLPAQIAADWAIEGRRVEVGSSSTHPDRIELATGTVVTKDARSTLVSYGGLLARYPPCLPVPPDGHLTLTPLPNREKRRRRA